MCIWDLDKFVLYKLKYLLQTAVLPTLPIFQTFSDFEVHIICVWFFDTCRWTNLATFNVFPAENDSSESSVNLGTVS